MEQITCGNCSKPIPQTVGKRKKEFCNSTCRSNHWQKEKRKSENRNLSKVASTPLENAARGRDASGINEDEIDRNEESSIVEDVRQKIIALEKEKAVCGTGSLGAMMKQTIDKKIRMLKKQINAN